MLQEIMCNTAVSETCSLTSKACDNISKYFFIKGWSFDTWTSGSFSRDKFCLEDEDEDKKKLKLRKVGFTHFCLFVCSFPWPDSLIAKASPPPPGGGGAGLPSNGLLGMCRWTRSYFHD